MDIQNTKKIIASILQDKVTAEECRNALKELEALAQAEKDLTKTNASLTKERDTLQSEIATLKGKIIDAEDNARSIIVAAEAKGNSIIKAAEDTANAEKAKADKKLDETISKTKQHEALEKSRLEAAEAAKSKLDAINEELEKSTASFKRLVG